MTLLLGGLFAEDLEVDEVIYAEVALRLHIAKAKVLKCIEATMKVFAWALSERKNFDFVFKNIGILVCREGSVIMRFFEDLLRDVDKTGKLANAFLQVSLARFQCTLYPLARGSKPWPWAGFPQYLWLGLPSCFQKAMPQGTSSGKARPLVCPGLWLLQRRRQWGLATPKGQGGGEARSFGQDAEAQAQGGGEAAGVVGGREVFCPCEQRVNSLGNPCHVSVPVAEAKAETLDRSPQRNGRFPDASWRRLRVPTVSMFASGQAKRAASQPAPL